jgi:hypothetical protein
MFESVESVGSFPGMPRSGDAGLMNLDGQPESFHRPPRMRRLAWVDLSCLSGVKASDEVA